MNKRQQEFGEEVKKRNPGREWKLMGMETDGNGNWQSPSGN